MIPEHEDQAALSAQVAAERDWHDQHFGGQQRRTRWIGTRIHDWLYSDEVARRADRYLASVVTELSWPGQKALECGCGSDAKLSILLKGNGVQVFSFDISYVALTKASRTSSPAGHGLTLFNAAAERLPISSESVDIVVGESVLHHFCLKPALVELKRILRKGGICIFREPLRGSPLVRFFRWLTPGDRTVTEKPFDKGEFDVIRGVFAIQRRADFFLLTPFAVVVAFISKRFATWLWGQLELLDAHLILKFPALRRWCWQTVVVFQKPA